MPETVAPKTLRIHMPQWQGGNNPPYFLGAQLLAWLAPPATGPVETVTLATPTSDALLIEDGIVGRSALLAQLDSAKKCIDRHQPDLIVVLGGDCLVDLAPFAYLNERYDGKLAVLWIDAHPDIMTPGDFKHAHAMVLRNLLGEGDPDFVRTVNCPLQPSQVMFAGLMDTLAVESEFIARTGLRHAGPAELTNDSQPVLEWLKEIDAQHVAIHFLPTSRTRQRGLKKLASPYPTASAAARPSTSRRFRGQGSAVRPATRTRADDQRVET
ncbi:Arginase/agmatinase/formimionoglutamate hydrolase arginase family-like protein [Burkholderia sp. H160]|nr:Arginase/agmatinase/formimionoglutamate hydrolase arginase family-like protein [Burkholderia sp. H160]